MSRCEMELSSMSDRLNDILHDVGFSLNNDVVLVKRDDFEWLIEQVGRVQGLERELEEHKSKFTVKYTMSLRKQNKRYREILKKIADTKGKTYANGIHITEIADIEKKELYKLEGEE